VQFLCTHVLRFFTIRSPDVALKRRPSFASGRCSNFLCSGRDHSCSCERGSAIVAASTHAERWTALTLRSLICASINLKAMTRLTD
jgi:hypothetical protein